MRFEKVREVVGDTPHTTPERGRQLYETVLEAGARQLLQLGVAHGVATCYLAAALDEQDRKATENGGSGGVRRAATDDPSQPGRVVAIDDRAALQRRPSVHHLLQQCGVAAYVTPVFTATSQAHELRRLITERTPGGASAGQACRPTFDFCLLDAVHAWETDGFAFFLVDKLLRAGGWMLLDTEPDPDPEPGNADGVFDLLVAQHPDYTDLSRDASGCWARKRLLPAGSLATPAR